MAIDASDQRSFPARRAMLAETAAFVEGFCLGHGVAHDDALRVSLIVEELFTNTIDHGHRRECDARIGVAITVRDDALLIRFDDDAPAFDPRARLAHRSDELNAPLEQRRVGGLGLPLLAGLARRVDYAYEGGRNRLSIEVARTALAPAAGD